jgi:two-component system alkaline phosphatase synthesis response regulator PhoP
MDPSLIYLVEDDENIRELVSYALKNSGFDVLGFDRAGPFFTQLEKKSPQLIILDIMLPGQDGLAILQKCKSAAKTQTIPIIMLTAKSTEYDVIKGLDMGADDYIKKPFAVLELISRVKAVLRRSGPNEKSIRLHYADIALDLDKRQVEVDGALINLTFKEFELLAYLLANQGIVLSRDKILYNIWGIDFAGETRTVDMHIKSLRQKLGDSASVIETVRGVGYKIGG